MIIIIIWNHHFETGSQVDPFSQVTIFLQIQIPIEKDKRYSVLADTYTIPIFSESYIDPTKNDTTSFNLEIEKINDIEVEYMKGIKRVEPGEIFSFKVDIENLGNAKDKIKFDVYDYYGWVLPIDEIYSEEFEVFEKREICVNISIPTIHEDDDAESGDYNIYLHTKSLKGEIWETTTLSFTIKEDYGCKIELLEKIKDANLSHEGTIITFQARVTNLGNSEASIKVPAIDEATNLSSSDFDKWDVFLETSTSKGKRELYISIKPTESKEITVKVEIHENGYINTYSMLLRAYPEGKSQYEAEPKRFWLNLTKPIYKLAWTESSKNQNKDVEPEKGTEIEYTVYIENLGTDNDLITVEVDPLSSYLKGWEVKIKTKGLWLDLSQLNEIIINVSEIKVFLVIVKPYEKADRDTYDIELTCKSEIDKTVWDRLHIQTTIKRPDLEVYAEDIILQEGIKEGDLAQIRVKVTNVGNAKARGVEITFYDNIGYEGEEIDSTTITILIGDSVTVTGDWDVGAGKYYITVVVDENDQIIESNEGNNKATAPALDIRQDLVIGNIEIIGKLIEGNTVSFGFDVSNKGSADVIKAFVRLKIGGNEISKQDVSIIYGQKKRVLLEWKIPNEGKNLYIIEVEVEDEVRNIDDSNKKDNRRIMEVIVEDKKEGIKVRMQESHYYLFFLIPLIFTFLIGISYYEHRKEELAVLLIIGLFILSLFLFRVIFNSYIYGLSLAVIITFSVIIPLNSDVKNYKRIRSQILHQGYPKPIRSEIFRKRRKVQRQPQRVIREDEIERKKR